jgi:uncharacterized membrane protein
MTTEVKDKGEKETMRIEAFSDGVFAIAITLLVLELKVPHPEEGKNLAHELLHQWPSYVAFLVSFVTILIMWINHHRLFSMIHKADQRLLIYNGILLLVVSAVPFPTALIAEYFRTTSAKSAALIYSGHAFNIAFAFQLLWHHAISKDGHLLGKGIDVEAVKAVTRQYRFTPLFYLMGFLVAFFSVTGSIFVNMVLMIFLAMPPDIKKHLPAIPHPHLPGAK